MNTILLPSIDAYSKYPSDSWLKDIKTFKQLVETFSSRDRWAKGEEIWPFGYTRDQREAEAETTEATKELFEPAEGKDLSAGLYETQDTLETMLGATSLGFGIVGIASPGRGIASAQLVSAMLGWEECELLWILSPHHTGAGCPSSWRMSSNELQSCTGAMSRY